MDIGLILTILWPYLAALYLLDSLQVVRGGFTILTGSPGSGFRMKPPGLRLAAVWPWSWAVPKSRDPVLYSTAGIHVRTNTHPDPLRPPAPDDFEPVPWSELGRVRHEGRKVHLEGGPVITLASYTEALHTCRALVSLRDCPDGERPAAIKAGLASAFDAEAVIRALSDASATALIRTSSVLFFGFLILVPGSLLLRLPAPVLWGETVALVLGQLTVTLLWWRRHRARFPQATADRLEELAVFLLLPVATFHAFGKWSGRLLAPFSDVAILAAAGPATAGEILRREHLRARTAASGAGPEGFAEAWRARVLVLEELAERNGVALAGEVLLENPGGDPGGHACPLCGAGYRPGVFECSDCRVPLTKRPAP